MVCLLRFAVIHLFATSISQRMSTISQKVQCFRIIKFEAIFQASLHIQVLVMNAVIFSSSCLHPKSLIMNGVAAGHMYIAEGQRCKICSAVWSSWPQTQQDNPLGELPALQHQCMLTVFQC